MSKHWSAGPTFPSLAVCKHCSEDLKDIFPEMKLRSLVPNFYIHIYSIYIFLQSVLFGISTFLYCVRELSAQPQEQREWQGTAAKQWLSAVPCPPLYSCSWAESSHKWPTDKFPIWKIMHHKLKQLILVVNILISLRVNEIPNKTFTLNSHRTSFAVCGAGGQVGPATWWWNSAKTPHHLRREDLQTVFSVVQFLWTYLFW